MSPLALTSSTFSRVITILDSSLATHTSPFAIHAQSSSHTLFLSGLDIATYLRGLETAEVKVVEVDFEALKAEGSAAPTGQEKAKEDLNAVKAQKEKEDARIEGAVQIAIGVKKEVDFAAWYTNV